MILKNVIQTYKVDEVFFPTNNLTSDLVENIMYKNHVKVGYREISVNYQYKVLHIETNMTLAKGKV